MKVTEFRNLIREEVRKVLEEGQGMKYKHEEKSDLSNILFDISTLLDSLDYEQLKNVANLNSADSKLLRKSIDGMMNNLKPIKHLIDTNLLSK